MSASAKPRSMNQCVVRVESTKSDLSPAFRARASAKARSRSPRPPSR